MIVARFSAIVVNETLQSDDLVGGSVEISILLRRAPGRSPRAAFAAVARPTLDASENAVCFGRRTGA